MIRDLTPCPRCKRGWVFLAGGSSCVLRHRPACASVRARRIAELDAAVAERNERGTL